MKRIWFLALGFCVAIFVILALGGVGGAQTLLTASAPVGAGIATAFFVGGSYLGRGLWLFVGVLLGALGYVIGALLMTDDPLGLALGASIPVLLIALLTMWTRKESSFLSAMLGAGSVTGVYAYKFNLDPQSLNVSLPIAIGQTLLPLGLGFLAGMLVRTFQPDDVAYQEQRTAEAPAADTETVAA